MPQPRKITPEAMALLEREAQRRAHPQSNKKLAALTGLAPGYVARLVARMRREIEARESQCIDVSCGTIPKGQHVDDATHTPTE